MTEAEKIELNKIEDSTRSEILADYKNNILIEAGAGAGKTTILVDRLVAQVKDQGMDPAQIVAITFTEKAADELKGRFQARLLEEYSKASDKDREKLQNAVEQINDIQISTIHSFCNKMLKEMTFEAGLGLGFEVVQDAKEEQAMKEFFESFCRDKAQKADRERLAKVDINAEQLFTTFKKMCYKRNVNEWVYDHALALDTQELNKILALVKKHQILPEIYEILKKDKEITEKKKTRTIPGFTDDEIDDLGVKGNFDAVLKESAKKIANYVRANGNNVDVKAIEIISGFKEGKCATNTCVCKNYPNKKYDEKMLEMAKQSYKEIKACEYDDTVKEISDAWNAYRHAVSMELLVKAYNAYQKDKISGGRISNDELLIKTRDMLRESKRARDFFRAAYKYIYIDEYQDTDPVQTEILLLLTETEETMDKPLDEVEFLDGRFCLIGDPKQSIYAFRGADVRLYGKMRAAIDAKSNCKLYQMNRNHRSNEEICEWVNDKFKKNSGADFGFDSCDNVVQSGSTQAGFDGMLSAKPSGDTQKYIKGVYKYIPRKDEDKEENQKKEVEIQNDAKHVAYLIRNMIDSKAELSIYNAKTKETEIRAVTAGDFMIITYNKGNDNGGIGDYAAALKKLGIPVLVSGASQIILDDEENKKGSPLVGFKKLLILSDYVAARKKHRAYHLALVLMKIYGIDVSPTEVFSYSDIIHGEKAEEKKADNAENNAQDNVADNAVDSSEDDADDNAEKIAEQIAKDSISKIQDEKLRIALSEIAEFVKVSKSNPLQAFEMMAQSYKALLNEENSHEELLSEIGGLEQILEQVREASYGTYAELNDQVKLIINGKNEKELPMGEEESKDAVRVMNAHQAKGLEAKIVILACPVMELPKFKDKVFKIEVQNPAGGENAKGFTEVELDSLYTGANKYIKVTVGKSNGFDTEKEPLVKLNDEEKLRVIYVAATRAEECLIISEANESKPNYAWDNLSCDIDAIDDEDTSIPEYQKMIAQGAYYEEEKTSSKTQKLLKIEDQLEEYQTEHEKKTDAIEKLITVSEITIRPSDQENHGNNGNTESSYMRGNLYGTMMHRFFELLIGSEWKKKKACDEGKCSPEDIRRIDESEIAVLVRRAVETGLASERLTPRQCKMLLVDQNDKLNAPDLYAKDEKEQLEKLTEHLLPDFSKLAEGIMKDEEFQKDLTDAKQIFTELPFELNLDEDNINAIAESIKGGYIVGQGVHIRGTMDLLLELEDKFIIWDYKSDVKQVGEEINDLEARLISNYTPQLNVYRAAIKNIVRDDPERNKKAIETKLYQRFRAEKGV